jgi:aerobic carbon-monoxide dehydrogenase small subunit
MTAHKTITVSVNGATYERLVEPRLLLSDFLRHDLGLTGTHVGCEHGICGACTIIVNGDSVRSCLMLAVQADGAAVETVESLGTPQKLNSVQKAFQEQHALQCGFCTPGMLMTGRALLDENPNPTEQEIRTAISGAICRCTGYKNIVAAIQWAAEHEAGTRQEA